MIDVSAAIIKNETGEILICQRGKGGVCEYLWEFPGGKLEAWESPEECLVRECREELGIEIMVQELFAETTYSYPDITIAFSFFCAEVINGEPTANVHKSIQWVLPDELKLFEFCPADIAIIEKLIKTSEVES